MGTKSTDNGLNDQNNSNETTNTSLDDFDSISEALSTKDFDNLGRLMSAKDEENKEAPKDEDEDDEEESVTDEEESSEKDGDDDSQEETDEDESEETEAAESAASTAKKTDEDLQAELHRLRSDAGRVPFLQRQLAELQRELRANKARSTQVSSEGKAKPADLNSVELDAETQKEIDELKEVDPVLARTIERIAKTAIYTANSRADHVVDTLTQAEREQEEMKFLMEQKSILAQKIPQHDQIFQSNEWKQWKDTLTPGQRALAESAYASEVETAIYAFAAEMRRRNGVQESAAGNNNPPQDSEVRKARQEKVKTSPAVKPTAAKHSEEFDSDKAFMEMYNSIATANHIIK